MTVWIGYHSIHTNITAAAIWSGTSKKFFKNRLVCKDRFMLFTFTVMLMTFLYTGTLYNIILLKGTLKFTMRCCACYVGKPMKVIVDKRE